jgi:AcrR family transcriptional regulator
MPAPAPPDADSRTRIASSARRLFAERGYERTTIRDVAAGAEIDPSLVIRYFGSKSGLFAAVTEYDLRLPSFRGVPREALAQRLVRHFLARWQAPGDDALVGLLRASTSNEEARSRMRAIFRQQLVPEVRRLLGNHPEADRRAELLVSQMMGLALCRFVLALPFLSSDDEDAIVAAIAPVLELHLFAGLPPPAGEGGQDAMVSAPAPVAGSG